MRKPIGGFSRTGLAEIYWIRVAACRGRAGFPSGWLGCTAGSTSLGTDERMNTDKNPPQRNSRSGFLPLDSSNDTLGVLASTVHFFI
jgi:hypothetical protein